MLPPKPVEFCHTVPTSRTARRIFKLHQKVRKNYSDLSLYRQEEFHSSIQRPKYKGRQRVFEALNRYGEPITILVARISPGRTKNPEEQRGTIGFFESLNEPDVAQSVLQNAVNWLRNAGCQKIVGPLNGDTWDRYRFNVGPNHCSPFLGEPTNPNYYPKLWLDAGFILDLNFQSLRIDSLRNRISVLQKHFRHARSQGFEFREFNPSKAHEELKKIHELTVQAFRKNAYYEPISLSEFNHLYRHLLPLINPRLVQFALNSNGKEVGFLFCIQQLSQPSFNTKTNAGANTRTNSPKDSQTNNIVNFKTIGVLPQYRKRSIAGALVHQGLAAAHEIGCSRANLCLIRDGSPSSRLGGPQAYPIRNYHLYEFGG